MKIIKQGEAPKPNWIGEQITCERCETIYELEERDVKDSNLCVSKTIGWFGVEIIHCTSFCPHCRCLNRNKIQK